MQEVTTTVEVVKDVDRYVVELWLKVEVTGQVVRVVYVIKVVVSGLHVVDSQKDHVAFSRQMRTSWYSLPRQPRPEPMQRPRL